MTRHLVARRDLVCSLPEPGWSMATGAPDFRTPRLTAK